MCNGCAMNLSPGPFTFVQVHGEWFVAERERFTFPSDDFLLFTTEFTTKLAVAIINPAPILFKKFRLPFRCSLYIMLHHYTNILDISHSH